MVGKITGMWCNWLTRRLWESELQFESGIPDSSRRR